MPKTHFFNDFSAGWCPADDPINGRKNGLLRMDSLELDNNGALRMCGGSFKIGTNYPADAHSISSKFLKDGRYSYVGLVDGSVYRNNTSIIAAAAGSLTRTGFGAAYDYVIACSGAKRVKDDATTVTDLGITRAGSPAVALGGAGVLNASYEYVQINVNLNGSYIAKSPASSASSGTISPVNQKVTVTPAGLGGTTNAWIFRRSTDGGKLDQYYRIANVTSNAAFDDNMDDQTALDTGITLSLLSLTVNSTDLPDDILEVVGPINGRMIYFTKKSINFSEVNSPDSYVPGQSINYAGGATGAEIFLFARKLDDNVTIVATTKDFYILMGTFVTQPDGQLDIYFRSLTVENPAIGVDADVYQGSVVCMTASGWKLTSPNGTQTQLTDPRIDRLYRGETVTFNPGGYPGIPILIIPQLRYPCCVVRDKLYTCVPDFIGGVVHANNHMEVYDFKRKYWRPVKSQTPSILFGQEDDSVLGFTNAANGGPCLVINDYYASKVLFNGLNQTVVLISPIFDDGLPRNRKDFYNLKFKINTYGSAYTVGLITDNGNTFNALGTITNNSLEEVNIPNLAGLVPLAADPNSNKNWQFYLAGSSTDLLICDISLDYDPRPNQVSHAVIVVKGGPNKKRVRTQPFKIDTINSAVVTCVGYVDGVAKQSISFGPDNYEKTYNYFFKTDVFGTDYKYTLDSLALFEIYEMSDPAIAEVLPLAKQFEQLGPVELFRYGKLKEFEIRVLPFGTTIPYEIFFEDGSSLASTLTVVNGKDQMVTVNLPKEVEGSVLRIELGPTAFDFHLFYGRMKVQKSGRDSEIQYVTIAPGTEGPPIK